MDDRSTIPTAPVADSIRFRALLLVIVLFVAAMRLWRSPWSASDLAVIPDSIEYAVGAQRLATLGHYDIEIEGVAYPPRYPPWFSALLAPAYVVAPNELGAGIVVVFGLTLSAVAAAFVIGGRLAGDWGAVAAGLALACYGEFRRDAMKIMTDVPALAFALWACVIYLRLRRGDGRGASWLLAGFLCAAAFALRLEMLALCAPFGLLLLRERLKRIETPEHGANSADDRSSTSLPRDAHEASREHGQSRIVWMRDVALFATPVLAALVASAIYNRSTFGSWRRTGYDFWLPELHEEMSQVLSPEFISANLMKLTSSWALIAIGFGIVGGWRLLARKEQSDSACGSHSLKSREQESIEREMTGTRNLAPDSSAHAIESSTKCEQFASRTAGHAQAPMVRTSDASALMTFFLLGAIPGTLFHLFYFYQDLRFHLFPLALVCIAAGAGVVTFVDENARSRCDGGCLCSRSPRSRFQLAPPPSRIDESSPKRSHARRLLTQ